MFAHEKNLQCSGPLDMQLFVHVLALYRGFCTIHVVLLVIVQEQVRSVQEELSQSTEGQHKVYYK